MKLNFFEKFLGSGFGTGYLPGPTGTFGSLVALLIYFIPDFENLYVILPAILIFTILGIFIGNKFDSVYGKDPKECTIDEVVGMWISLLFLPKNIFISALTFFVWRFLDIVKPFPARRSEQFKGGLGIMADDVISGIYTCLLMNLISIFFNL